MAKEIETPVCLQERERNRDWLTALIPVILLGFFYFRWAVVTLTLVGTAAYAAVVLLLERWGLLSRRLEAALVTGMLVTCCLPSTAPLWTAALACAVAALLTAGVDWLGRRFSVATAPVCPALVGYLLVRYVFPSAVTAFELPVQWAPLDGVSGATPLAALSHEAGRETMTRMVTGVHGGSIGEGCVLVLVLAAGYLLLRHRLRLIAPGVMLATVCLLSWLIWDAPLYGVLVGGTVLAALLLADRAYTPASYGAQVLAGVAAGGVTVLLRATTGTDGTAVGVTVACVLSALYPVVSGWIGGGLRCYRMRHTEKFAKTENKG